VFDGALSGLHSHAFEGSGFADEFEECLGEVFGVSGLAEHAGFAFADGFGDSADAGADDDFGHGHGFDDGGGEGFADAGLDVEVHAGEEAGDVLAEAGEYDAVGDVEFLRELLEGGMGAADEEESDVRGFLEDEFGGAQEDGYAFAFAGEPGDCADDEMFPGYAEFAEELGIGGGGLKCGEVEAVVDETDFFGRDAGAAEDVAGGV